MLTVCFHEQINSHLTQDGSAEPAAEKESSDRDWSSSFLTLNLNHQLVLVATNHQDDDQVHWGTETQE